MAEAETDCRGPCKDHIKWICQTGGRGKIVEYDIEISKPLVIIGMEYPIIDGNLKSEIIHYL